MEIPGIKGGWDCRAPSAGISRTTGTVVRGQSGHKGRTTGPAWRHGPRLACPDCPQVGDQAHAWRMWRRRRREAAPLNVTLIPVFHRGRRGARYLPPPSPFLKDSRKGGRDCALSAPARTLDTCADALKRRGAPSKPSRGCSVSPGAIFFPHLCFLHIKASGAVTSHRSRCGSDHHAQNSPPSTLPNKPGPRFGFD